MVNDDVLYGFRLRLFNLAEELGIGVARADDTERHLAIIEASVGYAARVARSDQTPRAELPKHGLQRAAARS